MKATLYTGSCEQFAYSVDKPTREEVIEHIRSYYLQNWYSYLKYVQLTRVPTPEGYPKGAEHYTIDGANVRILILFDNH